MCGIIGIASQHNVTPLLLKGLKELEYRGYDSSGISVINGKIECVKVHGTVSDLESSLAHKTIHGNIGIGHTRWATHGSPSVLNAHPHITNKVAIAHNGIIENVNTLRTLLKHKHNISCKTGTDTEVIALLMTACLEKSSSALESTWEVINLLEGSFTFTALILDENLMIAVKKGSPLLIGIGKNSNTIVCSDMRTLSSFTSKITHLEDYDVACISHNKIDVYNKQRVITQRNVLQIDQSYKSPPAHTGKHPNFMLKEIFEQPEAILKTLQNFVHGDKIIAPKLENYITIVACGSSYFAGLIAKYWLQSIASLNVTLEIASEFIYQQQTQSQTILFISQSGETADILKSIERATSQKQNTIGLTNSPGSSLTRLANKTLYTATSNEIGVASTKTFTAQLIALQCLAISQVSDYHVDIYRTKINSLCSEIENFLYNHDNLKDAAKLLIKAKSIMYIGRGTSYGLAMEGALKLKELSYLTVEGIAAGELKHGTLALIDENVITVAIAPYNNLFYKTFANIQEIIARGGKIISLTDQKGKKSLEPISEITITLPTVEELFSPILYAIPVQLLAYYAALSVGNNVDRPRNLAKSVTVE